MLSTCGLNPGDSGGPLLNKEGKVIGVSFAEPKDPRGRNLSKFFYHVHLDELKAFLEDRGKLVATPAADEPEALVDAGFYELRDFDGDGQKETLLYGRNKGVVAGMLVDLNHANGKLPGDKLEDTAKWKFQFAVSMEPCLTFFDTDGDGRIDLILRDVDGARKADEALRRDGNKWQLDKSAGHPLYGPRQKICDTNLPRRPALLTT